jgi:hypothetical protein
MAPFTLPMAMLVVAGSGPVISIARGRTNYLESIDGT